MKNLGNQRGYALLIVMLTIIIFLSLSAVFVKTSLSHVTQEQTVDKNNQAIVASEMGIKKVTSNVNNEILIEFNRINKEINDLKKKIKDSSSSQEKIELQKQVDTKLNNADSELERFLSATLKDRIYNKYKNDSTNLISSDGRVRFSIPKESNQYETFYRVENIPNKRKVTIYLKGKFEEKIISDIHATIEVDKIKISESKNLVFGSNIVNNSALPLFPGDFSERCLDIKNIDKRKLYNCKIENKNDFITFYNHLRNNNIENSNFNVLFNQWEQLESLAYIEGFQIYVQGDMEVDKMINLSNFKIFVDGMISGEQANNLNKNSKGKSYLITRELDIKMFNGTGINDTNVLLLGTQNGNGFIGYIKEKGHREVIESIGKIKVNNNSNFCVNLDGFTQESLNRLGTIDIVGNGKVIFLRNSTNKIPPMTDNASQTKLVSSVAEFRTTCGVSEETVINNALFMNITNVDYSKP